ncbi:hypothetical protein GTU79_02075 [Sodalis ligni]|uniref:hypothetical protein n=1 Tax=Sodalis ligni TaxID=2697027 RepID=UPI001BDE821D|nr:hypothetical protein [Sodalis ligni]QWA11623.1 hypothetical protein GTU79_02075 [Sodalis ligni]
MLKSDKEKYDNHIRKLKGSFENPMIKSKGVETKGLDILTILNENSRYDGNSHSNYSCNDELNMTLQEGLNPNFIAALTSEDQYIEFKHALGFFNKKDNAICFYFSRGESVKLKLNEKGLLLRSSGKSLNMLKIFDAGILKPRLANRMRIDIRDVIEDTEPVELKIVNSNGFIRLLEIVLKKVRDLYKGSQYKSTNKIRNHLSSDVEDERHRRLNVARNETENLDINLIKSIELETGNCGEMAHIALAICQKYKLNPLLIEYDTKEGFSHTVCGVSVDGSMYILDPWANILSEDNKHRTMLESKLSKWNSVGKLVIKPFNATSTSESSPKGLDGLPVSPGEAQSLVVTGRFNYTYDIVSNSFIDFIEKKLAQKLTKLYLEKDALQEM